MEMVSIYNEKDQVIETQLYGDVTIENVFSFIDKMIELSLEHNNYQWIINYTNARYKLGTFDIYYLPNAVYEKLSKLGDKRDMVKRAIVCVNDKEDFSFLYSVALKKGQNLKIFDTRTEALEWLQSI